MFSFTTLSSCNLCPRCCGANRLNGRLGFCGEGAVAKVGAILPHFGEEPPISGTDGSGTVFFAGCTMGCFFCQNHQLSLGGIGKEYSIEQLFKEVLLLVEKGVHNINFVTPDHFVPHIAEVVTLLRRDGKKIPIVMNSSGFHSKRIIHEWNQFTDIFLPDFKFGLGQLSKTCVGRDDYPTRALESIKAMVDYAGFLDVSVDGKNGTASSGVLVRHLVLPGQIENSLAVLKMLANEFGQLLPLSVMSQYRPNQLPFNRGESFNRILTQDEYNAVLECIYRLGFSNYLIQSLSDRNSGFTPDFSRKRPFAGNRLTDLI